MMGHQHALAGAGAWCLTAPALGFGPAATLGGVALAVGASMVPDLDQHGSTIGRTYGPVTNVLARVVGAVAGGHRNGTHSLLGLAAVTGLAYAATTSPVTAALWLWLLLGVAARVSGLVVPGWPIITAVVHAVVMAAVVTVVMAAGVDYGAVLPAATLIGAASHLVTDALTPEGVPPLWPLSRARVAVPLVVTGSRWTTGVVTLVLAVFAAWAAYGAVTTQEAWL